MFLKDSETQLRFMEIISDRASRRYLDPERSATPTELSEAMSEHVSLDTAKLSNFFWGQLDALVFEERRVFSIYLDLQFDLFELLIQSFSTNISKEIIIHTLETVISDYLEPTECQGCAQLESVVLDSDLSYCREIDLYCLVLDVLEHVIDLAAPKKTHVPGEYDLFEEHTAEASRGSDLTPAMTTAFESLSRSEQVDILALMYQKLSQSKEDSESLIEIETLSVLRTKYLSPLARDVFDALASGPTIGLSSSDLIDRLDLSNKRSLGQLERSVANSVERLNEENLDCNLKNPLTAVQRGREKHYILDIDSLENWRVLLRAEQKSYI